MERIYEKLEKGGKTRPPIANCGIRHRNRKNVFLPVLAKSKFQRVLVRVSRAVLNFLEGILRTVRGLYGTRDDKPMDPSSAGIPGLQGEGFLFRKNQSIHKKGLFHQQRLVDLYSTDVSLTIDTRFSELIGSPLVFTSKNKTIFLNFGEEKFLFIFQTFLSFF